MDIKILLMELCQSLEKNLIRAGKYRVVRLEMGFKPNNYFVPAIKIGTHEPKDVKAFFIEIFIDTTCVIRHSWIPKPSEDIQIIETVLARRVIEDAFSTGILRMEHGIIEYNKINSTV
jgi:hypothetical protein